MKKTYLVFMLLLSLTSCERFWDYEIEGNSHVHEFTVRQGDWKRATDDSGVYYYCTFREGHLDNHVFKKAIMQAYLKYDDRLSLLPFEDYFIDRYGQEYIEHFTAEFEDGYVTFIFKCSDHSGNLPYYSKYLFEVRFIW